MTIEEHIAYGNLMSMQSKYFMRAYTQLIKDVEGWEVTNYEVKGTSIVIDLFDPEREDFLTLVKERSTMAKVLMEVHND